MQRVRASRLRIFGAERAACCEMTESVDLTKEDEEAAEGAARQGRFVARRRKMGDALTANFSVWE
jgi:hypothetical protein